MTSPIFLLPEHEAYKVAIENLASIDASSVFKNSSPAHAAIVLGNILNKSGDTVKIFTGGLDSTVCNYDYYLTALKSYLDKKKTLSLIFEKNECDENSLAIKMIKEYQKENPKITFNKLKAPSIVSHFTIADDKMIRIETSKANYTAICSFNSPSLVEPLEKVFTSLLNKSITA